MVDANDANDADATLDESFETQLLRSAEASRDALLKSECLVAPLWPVASRFSRPISHGRHAPRSKQKFYFFFFFFWFSLLFFVVGSLISLSSPPLIATHTLSLSCFKAKRRNKRNTR
jgi:hypothetical protein